jgi:anti-sigma regulatory factor (Ser/Thr protein kinase)
MIHRTICHPYPDKIQIKPFSHGNRVGTEASVGFMHVAISYIRAKPMVLCRVKDPGEGFSLEDLEHAAIKNPPSNPIRHLAVREKQGLRPGGFGILVTQNIIDELIYGEKGNEVVLIKNLKPEQLET